MDAKKALSDCVKASDEVLSQALLDAQAAIFDYCHRTSIPERMIPLQVSLAAVYAHRILAAGEGSRSEGGVSVSYSYGKEIPEDMMLRLQSYRKLRQAVIAGEAKKS